VGRVRGQAAASGALWPGTPVQQPLVAAGYLADKGLRGLGVDKAIASGVTTAIDKGAELAAAGKKAVEEIGRSAVGAASNAVGGAVTSLAHAFGW
jgi:hypothetical protein